MTKKSKIHKKSKNQPKGPKLSIRLRERSQEAFISALDHLKNQQKNFEKSKQKLRLLLLGVLKMF